jgi:hypothetical protein
MVASELGSGEWGGDRAWPAAPGAEHRGYGVGTVASELGSGEGEEVRV